MEFTGIPNTNKADLAASCVSEEQAFPTN